ncbi:MAG: hypothetical protein KF830_07200 [Planctomycetes bacterium]|nr:hypothetical protein [Planctomycetota bacterium]
MSRLAVLAVSLSLPLAAQTTHLVGPGGFPQIRDALAVAVSGDVLHVQPGTYAHFTCDVGVTIRALVPGTVLVEFDPAFMPPGCATSFACLNEQGPTRFQPAPGEAVHVTGVDFRPNQVNVLIFQLVHRVVVTGGTVTFDSCSIQATGRIALEVSESNVHLQSCVVAGQGGLATGLVANTAHVIAVDTTFSGSPLTGGGLGGQGAVLHHSTLKASGCAFTGGINEPGLSVNPWARVWLSDSTLAGGSGGCGLVGTPAVGLMARSTITASSPGCPTLTTAPLVGVTRPTAIQNGMTFSLLIRTEPNTLVAIHASPRLAHIEIPDLFAQPIALDLSAFFLAGVYVSDGNGDLTASWTMPPGQFVDETLWLETIAFVPSSPIEIGAAVGGLIR